MSSINSDIKYNCVTGEALPLGLVTPHTGTGEGLGWSGADWNEETDFEYLEVSQSRLSQLQSELARVRVECQHWKELAQDRVSDVIDDLLATCRLCSKVVWGE